MTTKASSGVILHPMRKNHIINGNLDHWQRGSTFAATGDGGYTADRFVWYGAGGGIVTVNQSADVPTLVQSGTLSKYSFHVDVTTADTSIAAGDYYLVGHILEGYNYANLVGKTVTLSFWVKSPKTGIHSVGFRNNGADRSYVSEYTVNAANTWEKKAITLDLNEVGGTQNYTFTQGLRITWALMAGSNYTTSTFDQWTASSALASTNQVNVVDSTANDFRLAQVQLEVGEGSTLLEVVDYHEELLRCMRYYERAIVNSNYGRFGMGVQTTLTTTAAQWPFMATKRATPTISWFPSAANYAVFSGAAIALTNIAANEVTPTLAALTLTHASTGAIGQAKEFLSNNNTDAYLAASAEL